MTGALLPGAAGAALALTGNVPAIAGAARGRFTPQVLSWTGWAAIMVIGGWGSLRASPASGAYVLACAGGCMAVAVLALRTPPGRREPPVTVPLPGGRRARLDLVCLPGALAGLVLLAVVRDPGWSVGVSVATDAVLYVPTFADGWRKPAGQPLLAYALFAAGAAAAAAAVLAAAPGPAAAAVPLFAALAYPLYLLAADGGMSVLVVARRRLAAPAI